MKVFLSFDFEGVAGIVDWTQCRPAGGAAYETGRRLVLGEVNAALDGALGAGADEVVVNDSHGAMFNLDPEALHGRSSYLSGRHKPLYMMQGLDESFDAVLFVGYHGSISGEPSTLSHSYNPEVISAIRLGGRDVGESGVNVLVARHFGVPVAFLSGDAVTIDELGDLAPRAVTVRTKTSTSRFSALNLHPEVARERITEGVGRALAAVAAGSVPVPGVPAAATLEVDLQTADMAEIATWVRGVERVDTRTVRVSGDDDLQVYRAFVALTYITRQAGGR